MLFRPLFILIIHAIISLKRQQRLIHTFHKSLKHKKDNNANIFPFMQITKYFLRYLT